MTMPGMFPFDLPPVDVTRFCCADPAAGGCGHEITEHTGPGGECDGVFGCPCTKYRKHKAKCLHNQDGGADG